MATQDLIVRIGGDATGAISAMGATGAAVKGLTAILAAAAAAAAVVTHQVLSLTSAADNIGDLADKVGASAESLQKLEALVKPFGVSMESAGKAAQRLGSNLDIAAREGGPVAESLARIGLKAEDLQRLSPENQMVAIASGMERLSGAGERASVSMALMGRGGMEMTGALAQGGEELQRLADEAERIGILSNQLVAQGGAVADQFDRTTRAASALRTEALAPLVPVFGAIAKSVEVAIMHFRDTGALASFGVLVDAVAYDTVLPAVAAITESVDVAMKYMAAMWDAGSVAFHMIAAVGKAGGRDFRGAYESIQAVGVASSSMAESIQGLGRSVLGFGDRYSANLRVTREYYQSLLDLTGDVKSVSPSGGSSAGMTGPVAALLDPLAGVGAKGFAKGLEAVADAGDSAQESILEYTDSVWAARTALITAAEEAAKEAARIAQATRDLAFSVANSIGSSVSSLVSSVGGAISQYMGTVLDSYQETLSAMEEAEQARVDATSAMEAGLAEDKITSLEKVSKAQRAEILKTFHAAQAAAYANAIIQGALGIANIWGTWAAQPIVAGILTGIEAAAIGIQIGTIASQPAPVAHSGRYIGPELARQNQVAQGVAITALSGESVLNRDATRRMGGRDGVNAMNAGGSPSGGPTLSYQVWDGRILGHVVGDLAREGVAGFRSAMKPKVGTVNLYAPRVA